MAVNYIYCIWYMDCAGVLRVPSQVRAALVLRLGIHPHGLHSGIEVLHTASYHSMLKVVLKNINK